MPQRTDDSPLPWHWAMLNDFERNGAYRCAIRRALATGDEACAVALDIGCGIGLLSMLLGRQSRPPRALYACEMMPGLAEIARDCWAANEVNLRSAGPFTVLPLHSCTVRVGEPSGHLSRAAGHEGETAASMLLCRVTLRPRALH